MKKLIATLGIILFITGCSTTSTSTGSTKCFSDGMELNPRNGITAVLVYSEDIFTPIEGNTFTLDQQATLGYGFQVNNDSAGVYIMDELCNQDTNKPIGAPVDLDIEQTFYPTSTIPGNTGNYGYFQSEDADGNISNDLDEPANVSYDVFISEDGNEWELVAQRVFEFVN